MTTHHKGLTNSNKINRWKRNTSILQRWAERVCEFPVVTGADSRNPVQTSQRRMFFSVVALPIFGLSDGQRCHRLDRLHTCMMHPSPHALHTSGMCLLLLSSWRDRLTELLCIPQKGDSPLSSPIIPFSSYRLTHHVGKECF